jgi:hypothetical protein
MNILKLLLLILFSTLATANESDPFERGYQIAKESEQRDDGWGNFTADLLMILKNKQGEKSIRKISSKTLEVPGDGDKSLLLFKTPLDVKNTVFLSHSHKHDDDNQWLFLPALKRVKRISSSNKGGSFMGSEFSYEDMSSREIEKYTYKYIRDDEYKGRPVFVVEQVSKDPRSLYSKSLVWMDQKEYIPWKMEYFNRRNKHLKTLVYRKYKKYLDKYWRPDEMYMVNLRTRKSTILGWRNYRFRTNISERKFNPRTLAK